jgi:hypothetical protein
VPAAVFRNDDAHLLWQANFSSIVNQCKGNQPEQMLRLDIDARLAIADQRQRKRITVTVNANAGQRTAQRLPQCRNIRRP